MKLRLFRERLAESDLLDQVDYIGDNNPSAALRFIDAVESAFDRLSKMPEIGSVREFASSRLDGIRMWPLPDFPKYLIFYQVTEDSIRILRILHSARDIPTLFDEKND